AELMRDLEMVRAIVNRAHRRLAGGAAEELDPQQRAAARQQIERIEKQLQRMEEKLLPEEEPHVEPRATRRHSRSAYQGSRTTQGVAKGEIGRVLGISRVAVRKVLRSNSTQVPELHRPEKAEPYRPQILELFDKCQGNLVRVHEELVAGGAELSYPALTAFCR